MTLAVALDPPLSVDEDLARLRRLQSEAKHEAALRGVEPLLAEEPQNRDLLLIAARSLRHLGRIAEALDVLERLETLNPRFGRLYEERGLCHVARKDAPQSIEALLKAVNLNPALPMSWRMLDGVYRLSGDKASAATAAAHVATLKSQPPEVVNATALFFDGETDAAEAMIRAFLIRWGDHPEGMRLLGKIGILREAFDDAETLLQAVVTVSPGHVAARYDLVQCLVLRQKYADAQRELDELAALDPGSPQQRPLAGTIAVGLGRYEQAIAVYEQMIADAPEDPDAHLWLAHALKTVGRTDEAIEAYRSAARARTDFGDAYWSLANLKTYRFSDADIARMRELEDAPGTSSVDRLHFCFALGKALEDRGEIDESWTFYARGNALKRTESKYLPELIEANTRKQKEVCTRAFFDTRMSWGDPAPDPIFIVGLPRSGSTLIEQILASHSQVDGTQELADVYRIVQRLQGRESDPGYPRYPAALAGLGDDDVRKLGESYLADTSAHRGDRPRFIDKMPNNFRHIGMIHLMLPNAKIIDARREPMACCFSNLKQLFAQGQEFTYSFDDIARYYRTYLELMEHWDDVLPGKVLRVRHEDVIDDLDGNVRRILDFCDLPFEPQCLEFHRTERSVRTPSSEQVRRPIYRDGLDQWTAFEPWLEPLRTALGDATDRWRE
jgi:tetratricopeptide (TPR) repeat protein